MYKDPSLHAMQLTVPHSVYGECTYFAPKSVEEWLAGYNLSPQYCGGGSWGDGYTNGVTNHTSTYLVYNIQPDDATAFGIQFPTIKIHLSKQYDYS